SMLRIRRFEERCVELYSAAKIRGFVHLYIGEDLDDALSSLDTVTERRITDALFGDGPGATRLLVAHRGATAACADAVAWLDGGRVRAVGRHEELWRLAEYRAVFGDGAGPGVSDADDGAVFGDGGPDGTDADAEAVFGDGGPDGTDADDGGSRPVPDTPDGTSGESDVTGTKGRSGADAGDGALT
ncbi:hypothetical protein ABZ703_42275, partial [Streptomyces massasporeus]